MDQDSFRKLLQTPHAGSSATSRGSFLASTHKSKSKTIDASQPAFKPRKVKKVESQYRDRAAERRVGEGNDFAQVEAVLEDFERRTATIEDKNTIEEQRRYLGGDRDHSILVKGLDIALLQQTKARAAQSTDDDDSLEQAFQEVTTESSVPKKRTREDIIRELKDKRQKGVPNEEVVKDEAVLLEEAKKAGKFKPIGFKPIGGPPEEKAKKKKKKRKQDLDPDGGRKKKKRKGEETNAESAKGVQKEQQMMPPPPLPEKVLLAVPPEPEPEPASEDFDIFAGAGDYQGIDLGDDDDDDEAGEATNNQVLQPPLDPLDIPRERWFETDDVVDDRSSKPDASQLTKLPVPKSHSPPEPASAPDEDEETEQPTRLVPLQSSAIPSIRDLLAMDDAQDKRSKRKDKKKGGKDVNPEEKKKATAEAKVDRDYKRLKSYTEKKAGTSGATT